MSSQIFVTAPIVGKGSSIENSTATALIKMQQVLLKKGLGPENIAMTRALLGDMKKFQGFNAAYGAFFNLHGHKPARACMQTAGLGENDVQMTFIASRGQKEVILTNEAPEPIGPYVQAMRDGKLLHMSGQISPDGDVKTQAENVFRQLGAVLKAAGMTFEDVLKANVYMKNLENSKIVNDVFRDTFAPDYPSREMVQMPMLPKDVAVEITMVAGENARKLKKAINVSGVPEPGTYSHVVEFGDLRFLSGQICKEGDVMWQVTTILANLQKVLKAGNASQKDLIAATVFLPDLGNLQKIDGELSAFFGDKQYMVEVIQPSKLPFGVAVEISAIAQRS